MWAGNLYLGPFGITERIRESVIIFKLPVITKFRIFTISRIRGTSFNIKIRNLFIEIKYSITDRFVIFITNNRRFRVFEI